MLKLISVAIFIITLTAACFFGYRYVDSLDNTTNEDLPNLEYDAPTADVKVELIADENCVIISENPRRIAAGGDVTFEVIFNDNYVFSSLDSEKASYSKGTVKIRGCDKDTTVNITSECVARTFSFDISVPSPEFGSIEYSVAPGTMLENTVISLSAIPAEDQTFIGWSAGAEIVDGGRVLSYSKNFSFSLAENTTVYPNFLTAGYSIIKYDLNGGTTADGSATTITTQFKPGDHLCPNLIADNGTIVREGYTLLEFTENADGSGVAINPGGMAKLPSEGGVLFLYAQWAKWSDQRDFEYTVNASAGEVTLTGYTGDDRVLSIPAKIDGMPVTRINANAFLRKSFETLIIPSTVTVMESGAFKGCPNFDILYITDTFTSVPNDVFVNCRAFTSLRLNAALPPHFVTHAESIGCRLEVLLSREDDKPLIMFVGGSSCLHAIRAEYMESKLDYKYHILNCGTNAGGTGVLYMEGLSKFMREGDMIVNVPEYAANQMGGTEIVWRTFRATATCYNLYRYVDFSKYTNFFGAMSDYNTDPEARYAGDAQTYETPNKSLTARWCDLAGTRAPHSKPNFGSINVRDTNLSERAITVINNLNAELKALGITYYFSCAPICDGVTGTRSTAENLEKYYQKAVARLDCPVISHPADYRFANEQYYNSNYHLCTAAGIIRTDKTIEDLLAQWEYEQSLLK